MLKSLSFRQACARRFIIFMKLCLKVLVSGKLVPEDFSQSGYYYGACDDDDDDDDDCPLREMLNLKEGGGEC